MVAEVYPRVLFTVDYGTASRLGVNPSAPLVESRRTKLEKPPWRDIPPLRGNIETPFLRPLYLGESIAPFRALEPILAVIPWDEQEEGLLDASSAQLNGYAYLAEWLGNCERLWEQQGRGRRTILDPSLENYNRERRHSGGAKSG